MVQYWSHKQLVSEGKWWLFSISESFYNAGAVF